jgi:outer membrane protein TolC
MKRLFAVVLAAVMAGSAAGAAETPLTLAEAVALADRQNADVLAAAARAQAAAEGVEAVRRQAWPRLGLLAAWTHTNTPALSFAHKLNAGEFTAEDFAIGRLNDPPGLSHLSSSLSLEAPLDVFGRVGAQAEASRAGSRAAHAGAAEARSEARQRVVQAYWHAVLARRALEATGRALRGARAREESLQAQLAEGAALNADLLRARTRRRQREADLAERRGELGVALAALARALGAPPGAELAPVDPVPEPVTLDGDEAAWTRRALAERPALAVARERAEAARWGVRAERRSSLPEVAVWGQLLDDRNGFSGGKRTGTVGATVRWSAFEPTRGPRRAVAAAELSAAELNLRAAEERVLLETASAFRRAQAVRERWLAARGGSEEAAEALRVVRERREAGLATLTDELETEAASLGAELHELDAAVEAALADAALRRAVGATGEPASAGGAR